MNVLYTAKRAISSGYGRLYNWFCTQPQYTKVKYGYLYNWYSATDVRNIAASNAHVPSDAEWTSLINYLGGLSVAGGKLKEVGLLHWDYPNTGATNEAGFSAFGSGYRFSTGVFGGLLTYFQYWSSTIAGSLYAYNIQAPYNGSQSERNFSLQKSGQSIRLIVDTPIEIVGNSAIYVGNDLRRYKCCLINGVWYLAENLAETQYRNGDLIPKVTDNTAWVALTTGAMCAYNNDEANAFETASIAPVGFHVATGLDYGSMFIYMGAEMDSDYWIISPNSIGGKLKEASLTHWDTPNTDATNEYDFKLFGGGVRYDNGIFEGLKLQSYLWGTVDASFAMVHICSNSSGELSSSSMGGDSFRLGASIRMVKDDSTWTAGDTITDEDGNVYPLIKIGDIVITAKNWKCTKLNDGTPIPLVEDNTEWSALITPGQCVYENNLSNL